MVFLCLLFRSVPPVAWGNLAVLSLAVLNYWLHRGLWPHTPGARSFFAGLNLVCALLLPWMLTSTAWRVRKQVQASGWRLLWSLVVAGCLVVACVTTLLGLFGLLVLL